MRGGEGIGVWLGGIGMRGGGGGGGIGLSKWRRLGVSIGTRDRHQQRGAEVQTGVKPPNS